MLQQLLEEIARIAPYSLIGTLLNHSGQINKTLGVQHRVTARKRHIHIGLNNLVEQLLNHNALTTILTPRLRIVTPRTMVLAPRAIERGAKTYTIDRCAILDVKYAYAICG